MRGQVTLATLIVLVVLVIQVFALIPIFNGAVNSGWSSLSMSEKILAWLIVPSLILGLVMVPQVFGSFPTFFKKGSGGNTGGQGGFGGFGSFGP